MAAKKTGTEVAVQDQTIAVAATSGATPPSFLSDAVAEDAGRGVSRDAEDNIIPLVYILQAQSPQCNKRGPDYVEGAEAGDLWLRSSGLAPITGEQGFLFQPVFFSKDWVEWKPKRGGYADRHAERPAAAEEKMVKTDDGDEVKRWVMPNGNILTETRYHVGIVRLDDGREFPYIIPMAGSNHTPSRGWMFLMNSKKIGNKIAPSFAAQYRVKTKAASNDQGDWYKFEIEDAGWVDLAVYEAGRDLHFAFASGAKVAEAPIEQDAAAAASSDGAM